MRPTQLEGMRLTHIEEHAELGADPYYPYRSIEDTLLHGFITPLKDVELTKEVNPEYSLPSPVSLRNLADFISLAPYKRLKGTSNHGQDSNDSSKIVMVEYSDEQIVRKQAEKFAHAIVRGEDFEAETTRYIEAATTVLQQAQLSELPHMQMNGYSIEPTDAIRAFALKDGYVIDTLREVLPMFDNLPSSPTDLDPAKIQLTLINTILAERMRIAADEIEKKSIPAAVLPAVEQKNIQERVDSFPFTIELHQALFDELNHPDIPKNTLKLFAFLFERYALHMPLKVTLDGQQLGMGGIIHGLLEKIAEGIFEGEDLRTRSAEALSNASSRQDLVAMASIEASYRQIGRVDPEMMSKLKYSLPNYILLQRIKKELASTTIDTAIKPDDEFEPEALVQGTFQELIIQDELEEQFVK